MLRLKVFLMASVIAAPVISNAAEFTTSVEAKHSYFIDMVKDTAKDAEYKTTGSFYQGSGKNTKSTAVSFKFTGDNLSGKASLGVGFDKTTIGDWYVQYDFGDDLYFKLGKYGSPFGMKNADNYLGQGKEGGKYGTSGPDVNLTLGINDVQISVAPNDNVAVTDDKLIKNKNGEAVGTWIPKLALAYNLENDMIRFGISSLLNVTQQDFVDSTADTTSMTFMGWAAASHLRLHISKLWIQVSGIFAINSDLAGIGNLSGLKVKIVEDEAEGYTIIGIPVSIGVDITENLKFNAGFGMSIEKQSNDDAKSNTAMEIVAGLKISNLLPGLTVWPDFSYKQKKVGDGNPDGAIALGVGSKWAF